MRLPVLACVALLAATLSGCAAMAFHHTTKQNGSLVDYLYPAAEKAPAMQAGPTHLRLPVKVGIAFVPGAYDRLPEVAKQALLERVKAGFAQYDFIDRIELIPGAYLRPHGGFTNLEQAAKMFGVDVVALISYDQVQFNDSNALAVLYWTIIGAYVIQGDQYDTQTMLDTAVFDVASRKLLFRAPGTSRVKGSSTMAAYSEQARLAASEGYHLAVADMVPKLQQELEAFRQRAKSDANIKVERTADYRGGGALDGTSLAILSLIAVVAWGRRREP